ncbi:hypothetical protein B0T16DRAFT_111566 [Cercophora newfieldiana]|uniref:Uncharacterized protein n=1 Tax=Cercophora newfieldiana TaxID=92897 RepID=A0AA39YLE8_9PEZI|nr:hypothetical protein B0T16DRAFT_111566 [Cercophora newfieldiana]
MALDPGTILSIIDLIQRTVTLYERIEGLPQQMTNLGRRMQSLNIYLVPLEAFVKSKPNTASARLFPGQKEDLSKLLGNIKSNAEKVHDLFERYENGILSRSRDLVFRARWASQIWFSLVDSSPEKIQALMDDIEYDRGILNDYLTLLNARAAWERPSPQVWSPRPSAQPGQEPSSRTYNIIFVDPSNIGRSIVAEGLTKLLGQATIKANKPWHLNLIHSAGFFVRARGNCVDVIEQLNYSYPSWKIPIIAGGALPQGYALDALFDNRMFEQPFKQTIRNSLAARRSRGIAKDMFKRYDFVVVFTSREHDNATKLKQALRNKYGDAAFAKGKGRVLHLGAYLTASGAPKEIVVPKIIKPGAEGRQLWNAKVSQIKTAIKGFLKQEMDWVAPEQATTTI